MTMTSPLSRRVAVSVCIAFAVMAVLTMTHHLLSPRFEVQVVQQALAPLRELLGDVAFDNDPLAEAVTLSDSRLGPGPQQVYPIRLAGRPRATVVTATANEGYGGALDLLIAISVEGRVIGIRVVRHNETAGVGDAYTHSGAGLLVALAGRSLDDPPAARWHVRRDGGDFDHVTGATITPRAIVSAVRRALEWHADPASGVRR